MIENKDIDLNINPISRLQQTYEDGSSASKGGIIITVIFSIITLFFYYMEEPFFGFPLTLIVLFLLYFTFSSKSQSNTAKKKLDEMSIEKKKGNKIKKAEFKLVEKKIEGLVISKEIESTPDVNPALKKNKLILDNKNSILYYISLDNRTNKEQLSYKKVPYSEIVQAAVVIDEEIISKSSLASKVTGTVVGGLVGGNIGAIVGGTNTKKTSKNDINEIKLKVIINDKDNPIITWHFNGSPIKDENKKKNIINLADEWKSTIDIIINEENKISNSRTVVSNEMDSDTVNIKPSKREDKNRNKKLDQKEKIKLLKDLSDLKNRDVISDEDFQKLKQEIINE